MTKEPPAVCESCREAVADDLWRRADELRKLGDSAGGATLENASSAIRALPTRAADTVCDTQGPVKVTVTDVATGKVLDEKVLSNDYAVITQGNRYVKSVQMMGKRGRMTHMVCVAVAKDGERA